MSALTARRSAIALPVTPPASGRSASFEEVATSVLRELQDALNALLAAAPGETHRATDVEKAFGVDYKLAWQTFRIANAENPLAAGSSVPARVSMRKLLQAASKKRIPEQLIERVSAAFEVFEQFVSTDAGDRESLEALLSAFLPEERQKQELAAKAADFKARSQINGIAAEAELFCAFYLPARNATMVDLAFVQGHIGLRRIWPGAPIRFGYENSGLAKLRTLDGTPMTSGQDALLREFSTSPLPEFKRHATDVSTYYSVTEQDVGLRSAINLVRGLLNHENKPLHRQDDGRTHTAVLSILDVPSKRLTMDVFLHEDVYPGVSPELTIHDTSRDGVITRVNDPAREHDRLQIHESVRPLGTRFVQAKLAHIPGYLDMLRHAADKLQVDPATLRGYRLDVQYPVYATQYTIAFRLPEPRAK